MLEGLLLPHPGEIQGHKAMQLYVLGLVNHTHPPSTEFLDDAIVRNSLVDHGLRILRGADRQVNETQRGCIEYEQSIGEKSRYHSLTFEAGFEPYPDSVSWTESAKQLGHGLYRFCSYCSLANSAFACFRMGTSGSASFQSVRKSL